MWGPDLPGPLPTRLPQDNQRLGSPTLLRPLLAARARVGRFVRRLTVPRNLPAPGRRQSVYIVLRLRTLLCF